MFSKEKDRTAGSGRFHVGIDAGSVSVNCIVINEGKEIVYEAPYQRHFGRVDEQVPALMEDLYQRFGEENIITLSFTGNHGKSLSERLHAFYEFDTISQVLGATFVTPGVRTIISMGGQDTALFQIGYDSNGGNSGQNAWTLEYFNTNGPCASGTGSFIDQQAERLATSIYGEKTDVSQDRIDSILSDFIRLGTESQKPANVACRCTVFTKSDMIHLQNRGEKLEDIIYGLHVGNARNYMSTIVSNRGIELPIVFVGGLSLNKLQVKAFREYFPEMIIPAHNCSTGALGVALEALEKFVVEGRDRAKGQNVDLEALRRAGSGGGGNVPKGEKLVLRETAFPST
ncbi:MAG TPA: CoA activase, partial [Deltaproteobacteria bacterium]|nr:CoA activase [Deltaproteobacteria bacterium]